MLLGAGARLSRSPGPARPSAAADSSPHAVARDREADRSGAEAHAEEHAGEVRLLRHDVDDVLDHTVVLLGVRFLRAIVLRYLESRHSANVILMSGRVHLVMRTTQAGAMKSGVFAKRDR